uniref:Uncharacterized protein n=1 Tax=Romanomermis culicivorax TaxID=13658 RepID=A0A915JYR0_ROMCU
MDRETCKVTKKFEGEKRLGIRASTGSPSPIQQLGRHRVFKQKKAEDKFLFLSNRMFKHAWEKVSKMRHDIL